MKKLNSWTLLVLACLVQGVAADDIDWQSGLHYHAISPAPAPAAADAPIEVVEFFWYGCPHCYQFEPFVERWLETKPADVVFTQVPVMFGGPADLHAQAFYALEVMCERERVHEALFRAMHDQKLKLATRGELETWLGKQGVDVEAFRAAMDSFAVNAKVNRARALMRRYGVRSVPVVVVDGRYRSGSGFQGYEGILAVTDYLVDKVRVQRAAAGPGAE
ncbi:MAG: thiol:disulfide interchange protein DsbA/DsbL [Gammaproteobacteria bacterium]